MYFVHTNAKIINTQNWFQRSVVIALTKSDCMILRPLRLVCGENLDKMQPREILECFKQLNGQFWQTFGTQKYE